MPATIVVGGQFGSEGKGKAVALLAGRSQNPWLVRCGGPNSGHSVTVKGHDLVLRQVPASSEPERSFYCIAAGCVIDEELLINELDLLDIPRDRVIVDRRAVLVTEADRDVERRTLAQVASTASGTGAALIRRMQRLGDSTLAEDSVRIRARCRVETVAARLHDALEHGRDVIVEGTQGFGLSLLHGPDYPFLTARDTTAAGFCMEVGLSPRDVERIVMVIRTFPIRVGGPSGPLADETSWEAIAQSSGAPETYPEFTSVTKRLRRVGQFDLSLVQMASRYNRPTSLAVMGLDRLDYANTGVSRAEDLSPTARKFLAVVEAATGVPVELAGTGFSTFDVVRLVNHEISDAVAASQLRSSAAVS